MDRGSVIFRRGCFLFFFVPVWLKYKGMYTPQPVEVLGQLRPLMYNLIEIYLFVIYE